MCETGGCQRLFKIESMDTFDIKFLRVQHLYETNWIILKIILDMSFTQYSNVYISKFQNWLS